MRTKKMIMAALFAALTAVGAFIKIPLGITSITLQFFFTAMAGLMLGPAWAAASQAVYVVIGLIGVPVFTLGGGFSYIFQPSFGFLLGLIPSTAVIGAIGDSFKKYRGIKGYLGMVLACVAGLAVLYIVGVPYMYLILNVYLGKGVTVWYVIEYGMLVYLPGDAIKIVVAAFLGPKINRLLKMN